MNKTVSALVSLHAYTISLQRYDSVWIRAGQLVGCAPAVVGRL